MKEKLEAIEQAFEQTLRTDLSDASKLGLICIQLTGLLMTTGLLIDQFESSKKNDS